MWQKLRKQGSHWCCRIGLGLAIGTVLIVLASNNRAADQSYRYQALATEIEVEVAVEEEAEESPLDSEEVQIQLELERLAGEDPLGLLRLAQESYHKSVRDYTCTFIKQERINGHFKDPEKIRVYFKEAPFSVLMNWQEPKGPVDTLLYVEKDGNNTILVHPSGLAGPLVRTVRTDINDPRLKKSSLRTPAGFGFGRVLDDMVSIYEEADKNGDLVIEYLDSKVQGSSDRQANTTPLKIGTILTKEDIDKSQKALDDIAKEGKDGE